jgi:virulence-associated protein VagC
MKLASHFVRSVKIDFLSEIAIPRVPYQTSIGIRGRYAGMLFRRTGESTRASLPKDVRLSQTVNIRRPGRQRITSPGLIDLVNSRMISATFITVYFYLPLKQVFFYITVLSVDTLFERSITEAISIYKEI